MFFLIQFNKILFLRLFCLLLFRHYFNLIKKNIYPIFFTKLVIKGLGYRCFIFNQILYITIGMSHYFCLNIPNLIIYFLRNKSYLFLYSYNQQHLKYFCSKIEKLKPVFKYKERGFNSIVNWNLFFKKRVTLQK